jgi:hypothetical protein
MFGGKDMTRKDFQLIAQTIADLMASQKDRGAFAHTPSLEEVAQELADALATTNPQFDRTRFLTACGVN